MTSNPTLKISIVGPCAAGKSTLRQALHSAGYRHVRNPAQEHSYVPDMWRKLTAPDVLVYLDVDEAASRLRRPQGIDSGRHLLQNQRLAHARQHAHLYLNTSSLTPTEVAEQVVAFLARQ